jgi:hypothetical protein
LSPDRLPIVTMALTNGHGSSPLDLHPNRFLFTSESVGRGHPECVALPFN